jgi:methyl-accepting chemotaxis protein
MSINRLVSGAILLIALFMAALGGYVVLTKITALHDLAAADLRLAVIRAVGNVPRYLNPERGVFSVDEQIMKPGDQAKLAELAKLRDPTDSAVTAALAEAAAIQGQLDDDTQISAQVNDVARRFKEYRQAGDAKLALPIDQRGDAATVMIDQNTAINAVVSELLREQLRRIADGGGVAYRNIAFADQVWALRDSGGRQAGLLQNMIVSHKPVSQAQRSEQKLLEGRIQQAWSNLAPLIGAPSTPPAVKAALSTVKSDYFGAFAERKKKLEENYDTGAFPYTFDEWHAQSLVLWPEIIALREAFYDQAESDIGSARSAALMGAIMASVVLLVALGLAGGILLLVRRRVTAPIGAMTQAMGRIAEGELATAIPGAGRTDEIGEMAKAALVFRDAAAAKLERDRETEDDRRRGEGERRRAEAEAIERERALVCQSIGAGLARLAAQDLVYRMTDDLPDAYRRLQADFNQAMQQLEDALLGVAENVHAMEAGSNQIAGAADSLSQRTEQQAASLEETAAALEEITTTVDQTADGARNADKMVGSAKVDAERSGDVVRQAIEAMSGIEKSSKQIGQIIGVIDEIAFQTNLLALNAGVEAARAGDAGRGFAVVASEVRALAQRSAEAAKEIKGLISASTAQVDAGVGLVADSGEALARIVGQIGEVSTVVAAIANGATEQAAALKEINTAVNQMDQMTQRNAAMVEETTAASHALLKEASTLMGAISRFQVSKGVAARKPAVAATKPAPKSANAMRPAASAQRKPQPQAAAQNWEEF